MNFSLRAPNRRLPEDEGPPRLNLLLTLPLLLLVTVVALAFAYTTIQAQNLSYEVSRGLETQRELMETGRRLRVELNNLRAPERLEQDATRRGLAPPKTEQVRGLK